MIIRKDEPIVTIDDLLALIFGEKIRYIDMSKKIINAIVRNGYLEAIRWTEIVIDYINDIFPALAEDLKCIYNRLKENNASRYYIVKALREHSQEYAKEHNIPNPFNVATNIYIRTIKRLKQLGLIYRKHGRYYLSEQFVMRLQEIINLWSGYCKKAEKRLYDSS